MTPPIKAGQRGRSKRCLICLRIPCMCADYPGMQIDDDTLIDFATAASWKALRLRAEVLLRQRYPARRAELLARTRKGR
jgi:hypothetical protein